MDLRLIHPCQSTRGPVLAVKSVLQVDNSLTDESVRAHQIPVEQLHMQDGVPWKVGDKLEAPGFYRTK
ncbi:hypothetical protein TNCV_1537581 [Trichonephila clavipes]|nr:hypothetical protein TNCV_1537581 [Trichonephila clavipes]